MSGYLREIGGIVPDNEKWAFGEVLELTFDDPERVWRLTLSMIQRTTDELLLATVGAGPLEDLLCHYGPQFIDRVEAHSRQNDHFRACLASVWGHTRMEPTIYQRVQKAVRGDV